MLTAAESSGFPINTILFILLMYLPRALLWAAVVYVLYLLIKALRKYLGTRSISQETASVRKSLGETIREHRTRCRMTQEFVAEHLGVSRQAVSKWENGTSDPSTANLLALAKLFGVSPAELLRDVQADNRNEGTP